MWLWYIHTGRQSRCLTECVSEAWCHRDYHSINITFLILHEHNWLAPVLQYLLNAILLADICVCAWFFFTSATSNASVPTQCIHKSFQQCTTSPIETKWEALMPTHCVNAPFCNSYYLKCNKWIKNLTFQENSVINYSPSCRTKPVRPSFIYKLRYFKIY